MYYSRPLNLRSRARMIPVQAIVAENTTTMDKHQSKRGQFIGDGEQSYTVGRRRQQENPGRAPVCGRANLFNTEH
jgi:hypothetical protein